MQESTRESPFFLMYGRDPQLPTEAALTVPQSPDLMEIDSYKSELVHSLADAWKMAQDNVKRAQKRQKAAYDRSAKHQDLELEIGYFSTCLRQSQQRPISLPNPSRVPTALYGCTIMVLSYNLLTIAKLTLFVSP